ncbi:DUF4380 domain-containing protein [Microbulbifer litoralis]|uniref:DUF4380 domain-containing protein n=1 Tax=Microbulbifer litoralis TaxID=2933965 RepID=UPI002027C345
MADAQQIEAHTLENDKLSYRFTPQIGGRGLGFSTAGGENLLKVGAAVREVPAPQATAEAGFVPYFGHIVWPGPQGDWWKQQTLNAGRREAAAVWPPDPFTVLAASKLIKLTETEAEMVSPVSPVTGLQLTKRYRLDGDTLQHQVQAVNRRDEPVRWDIWFNTRVSPDARLYVPVRDFDGDLRLEKFPEMSAVAQADKNKRQLGLFDFARGENVKAKAFIEPAAGWIAAFDRGQLFLIEFEQQPRESIHPEQGQVEVYLEQDPDKPGSGVMELEVHAPYRELAPGESMAAEENWRALAYTGEDSIEGHLRALKELGLDGL